MHMKVSIVPRCVYFITYYTHTHTISKNGIQFMDDFGHMYESQLP